MLARSNDKKRVEYDENGFIVSLRNGGTDDRKKRENKKRFLKCFFAFFESVSPSFLFKRKKDRAVNFMEEFEKRGKIRDKFFSFKKRQFFIKSFSILRNKKKEEQEKNKLPCGFLKKTHNISRRNFLQVIFLLLQIFYSNAKKIKKFFYLPFLFVEKVFLRIIGLQKKFFVSSSCLLFGFIKSVGRKFIRIKKLFFKSISRLLKKGKSKKTLRAGLIKAKKGKRAKKEGSAAGKEGGEDEEILEKISRFYHSRFFVFKSILSFVFLLILLILPFKALSFYSSLDLGALEGRILGISQSAVGDLKNASRAFAELEMDNAGRNFSEASNKFAQARKEVGEINDLLLKLSRFAPQEKAKLASISKQIFEGGEVASEAGNNLARAIESVHKIDTDTDKSKIMEAIYGFEENIEKASGNIKILNKKLSKIEKNALPEDYRKDFLMVKEKAVTAEIMLGELESLIDKAKIFLGEEHDKKYLLVFQNNGELRATGGFIGSYAMIEFSEGKLVNVEIPEGGSYDTDGGLRDVMAAPNPLQLVSARWFFRDANWWPDWPTSAQKLRWFYENSGGPTVDGVISFTPQVLGNFLEVTGPLDMKEKYGIIINKNNYRDSIRKIIEEEKGKEDNKPKKIIASLFEKIMEELPNHLNREGVTKLLKSTKKSLDTKEILFYFDNKELQEEVRKRSWGGRIKETSNDYLSVINTNIAGGKSDRNIDRNVKHSVSVKKDGTVVDTLRIEREYPGASTRFYYSDRNVNWLRVYVPKGSKLLKARGFEKPNEIYFDDPRESWEKDPLIKKEENFASVNEGSGTKIYNESGKTVFANWTMLDPGEKDVIYLKYELPFKLQTPKIRKDFWGNLRNKLVEEEERRLVPYSLLVQKQPGTNVDINSELNLPDNFDIRWNYPDNLEISATGWDIDGKLNKDKFFAVILSKGQK